MNILIKIIFLFLIYPLSVIAHTSATPKILMPASTANKITLTVATTEHGSSPYNFEENGSRKGLSIDILNYIEKNSKYDFEFIILPWSRAMHFVAEGKIDLMLTLFKSAKREQAYHFIEPSYANEAIQLFTLTDNKFEFNGHLADLTPYIIGVKSGFSYGESFEQANYLTKFSTFTEEVLLKLLLGKRIDFVISNPLHFNKLISNQSIRSKVKGMTPYIAMTPLYIALTKKRKNSLEIKENLEQLTKQLITTPYYQELLNKYQLNFK
ncbi:ABC transporter substrate-binding protein [Paraglaciecola sp. L3A3]|uniref:substrate-binding periplasmic protein n=1 Tax=Paraglaciecola sp. L3A3 TaxID=2686358 RepID=UPI00131B8C64|nr:transporter substrate-binding domain-containing protein [Paraglaciecola sp. L3A3]